ncbi:hypothetical protein CapIbe_022064 [Capra ibex]
MLYVTGAKKRAESKSASISDLSKAYNSVITDIHNDESSGSCLFQVLGILGQKRIQNSLDKEVEQPVF